MTAMPRDRDFKRIVRQRMTKTGESYAAARAKLARPTPQAPSGLYPWDRFDETAKHVLAIAQAEAVKAQVGLILPDHLLLGLIRERRGGAARILRALGVRAPVLRAALRAGAPRRVQHPAGRIVAAASTRRVLDQALLEAEQQGREQVLTEDLLAGIFCETDDVSCRVLAQLGATADRAAALYGAHTDRLGRTASLTSPRRRRGGTTPPAPPPPHPVATGGLADAMQRGRSAAHREGAMFFRSDHLLSELVAIDSPTPALLGLLQGVGADLDELRRRLRPPRRVMRLEAEIWRLRGQEDAAVEGGDEERARKLLDEEAKLRDQLATALDAWNDGWQKPPARPM
jgi:ATP-dependent Clp protease ATP-binding subunit ClpA